MSTLAKKTFGAPDEVRNFPKGKLELIKQGELTFGKVRFEPGWKWSESVKPIVKTDSCLAPHTQYVLSGRLHVRMDDGTEFELTPGDFSVIPPGHDAWVVGKVPFESVDVTGMGNYAKGARAT